MPHFWVAGAVCPGRVCLAGELVPGFLDHFAPRTVTGQRVAGNVIPVAAMERVGGPAELIGVIESVGCAAEPPAPPSPGSVRNVTYASGCGRGSQFFVTKT
jgi:hypothetical protein